MKNSRRPANAQTSLLALPPIRMVKIENGGEIEAGSGPYPPSAEVAADGRDLLPTP